MVQGGGPQTEQSGLAALGREVRALGTRVAQVALGVRVPDRSEFLTAGTAEISRGTPSPIVIG